MEKLPYFLLNIIDSVVLIVVVAIGILVMLFKFRSLGRAALFGAAGFLMLGTSYLLDIGQGVWALFIYDPSYSQEAFETVYWIKTAVAAVLSVIGLILLIAAVVMKRPDPAMQRF